jgi:hypothetical protein
MLASYSYRFYSYSYKFTDLSQQSAKVQTTELQTLSVFKLVNVLLSV